jgi:acetyltransferase-like isoleucine patch superfamily enzyme
MKSKAFFSILLTVFVFWAGSFGVGNSVHANTITFDNTFTINTPPGVPPPTDTNPEVIIPNTVTADGFEFTPVPNVQGEPDPHFSVGDAPLSDPCSNLGGCVIGSGRYVGSEYGTGSMGTLLGAPNPWDLGVDIKMTHVSGTPFELVSFDAAELFPNILNAVGDLGPQFPNATKIVVLGKTVTGATLVHSFSLDSVEGFETFTLPSEWKNLEMVTFLGCLLGHPGPLPGRGAFAIDNIVTTSPLNLPPVADAGLDQIVESTSAGTATVLLDGTQSTDPESNPLSYSWTGPFGTINGPTPAVNLGIGDHLISLTVNDGKGGEDSDTVRIVVESNLPPPQIADGVQMDVGVVIGWGSVIAKDVTLAREVAIADKVAIEKESHIGARTSIGEGTIIAKEVKVGPDVRIGNYVVIEKEVNIKAGTIIGDRTWIQKETKIGLNVSIGNNVTAGKEVKILDGATVPDDNFIPATTTFPSPEEPEVNVPGIQNEGENSNNFCPPGQAKKGRC